MEYIDQLNIKGMVCKRCISVLNDTLINNGYDVKKITLGKVLLASPLNKENRVNIRRIIEPLGFELFSDRKQRLHSQIKKLIWEWINSSNDREPDSTLSAYLSGQLHINYDSLSKEFTSVEGITIEKYHIEKRIEAVKELLIYTDLLLSDIAFQKGFSSVPHLSSQFKKYTGLTLSDLRKNKREKIKYEDKNLDN